MGVLAQSSFFKSHVFGRKIISRRMSSCLVCTLQCTQLCTGAYSGCADLLYCRVYTMMSITWSVYCATAMHPSMKYICSVLLPCSLSIGSTPYRVQELYKVDCWKHLALPCSVVCATYCALSVPTVPRWLRRTARCRNYIISSM